jgi:hypothetical protein
MYDCQIAENICWGLKGLLVSIGGQKPKLYHSGATGIDTTFRLA